MTSKCKQCLKLGMRCGVSHGFFGSRTVCIPPFPPVPPTCGLTLEQCRKIHPDKDCTMVNPNSPGCYCSCKEKTDFPPYPPHTHPLPLNSPIFHVHEHPHVFQSHPHIFPFPHQPRVIIIRDVDIDRYRRRRFKKASDVISGSTPSEPSSVDKDDDDEDETPVVVQQSSGGGLGDLLGGNDLLLPIVLIGGAVLVFMAMK